MKKRIFSLLISVLMIFSASLCAFADGESDNSLSVDKIYGTKTAIYVLLNKDVTVDDTTKANVREYGEDTAFTTTVTAEKSNYLKVAVSPSLELAKTYRFDLTVGGETVSKKISFKELYFEDFNDATMNAKNDAYTNVKLNNTGTGYIILKNGMMTRTSDRPPMISNASFRDDNGIKEDWSDYTIEYNYYDTASREGVESGTKFNLMLGAYFYVQTAGNNMNFNDLLANDVSKNTGVAIVIRNSNPFVKYVYKDKIIKATDKLSEVALSDKVTGDFSQVDNSDVLFSASLFGENIFASITKIGESEPFYEAKTTIPNMHYHEGGFAAGAETDTMKSSKGAIGAYVDNFRAYKLIAGEVEYVSSIPDGSVDLYDVNSVTLDWNYDVDVTKDNFEIYEDGTKSYTDFSVEHNSRQTVITLNEKLLGERTYTIKFKDVYSDSDKLLPMDISFRTGGIYKKIDIVGDNVLDAKDENAKQTISVKGTTDKGTVFDIENTNIEYISDNSIIAVDKDGNLTSSDRGYAEINVKFTDKNTTNTNGDNNDNIFQKKIPAYSYMSVKYLSESNDFSFKDGVVIAEFTDDLSNNFAISFGENKPAFKTTSTDYTIGDKTVARANGTHRIELLKTNNEKLSVYLDKVKVIDNMDVTDLNTVSKEGDFDTVKIYNLIGNACTASFVNVRGSGNLEAVYSYEDLDNDKEEGTTFEWLYSADGNTFTTISGQTAGTISSSSYAGGYLKVAVTPKNKYESGKTVTSDAFYVQPASNPSSGTVSGVVSTPTKVTLPSSGSSGGSSGSNGTTSPTPNTGNDSTFVPFNDVASSHWAYASINAMKKKGVLNGFENGDYKPSSSVTRAEFVCALCKLLGLEPISYGSKFADVKQGEWYSDYVEAILQKGYIKGDENGNFNPNAPITREQMASIIGNILENVNSAEITYGDRDSISDWALQSVAKAFAGGIMKGDDNGNFNPKADITRAETAVILERLSQR